MGYRKVHVCVPNCIEKYIKLAYPGNGSLPDSRALVVNETESSAFLEESAGIS